MKLNDGRKDQTQTLGRQAESYRYGWRCQQVRTGAGAGAGKGLLVIAHFPFLIFRLPLTALLIRSQAFPS